jgi:hypothetical protein
MSQLCEYKKCAALDSCTSFPDAALAKRTVPIKCVVLGTEFLRITQGGGSYSIFGFQLCMCVLKQYITHIEGFGYCV